MRPTRGVVLASLATASSLLGDQMLYAVLPTLYRDLGLLPFQVGILLSANRVVRLASNHLAEWACRHWSLAWLLAGSLVVGALLNLVYGVVTLFGALLAARVVWGMCWSLIRQIGLMTVVDSVAKKAGAGLGRAMGFYSGISRMGSISGNLLGAVGHDLLGFTATLFIFAVASLLAVPLGPISRRGTPRTRPLDRTLPRVARPGLWVCGFASGCVGQGLLASTLGAVLASRLGDAPVVGVLGAASLTGLLLSSRWAVDLLSPFMGAMADRWGRRRAGALFFGAGALVLAGAATTQASVAVLALAVIGFYLSATGVSVVLQAEAGAGGGPSVAAYVTASDLGAAVGPNLGWWILQLGWADGTVFAFGSAVYAIAGLTAVKSIGGVDSTGSVTVG